MVPPYYSPAITASQQKPAKKNKKKSKIPEKIKKNQKFPKKTTGIPQL
jgi:hypothetical protein